MLEEGDTEMVGVREEEGDRETVGVRVLVAVRLTEPVTLVVGVPVIDVLPVGVMDVVGDAVGLASWQPPDTTGGVRKMDRSADPMTSKSVVTSLERRVLQVARGLALVHTGLGLPQRRRRQAVRAFTAAEEGW